MHAWQLLTDVLAYCSVVLLFGGNNELYIHRVQRNDLQHMHAVLVHYLKRNGVVELGRSLTRSKT